MEHQVQKAKETNFAQKIKESKTAQKLHLGGKAVGGYIATQSKKLSDKLDTKIDANEKLSKARSSVVDKANKVNKAWASGMNKFLVKIGVKL